MFIPASVLEAELNRPINQMYGKAAPGFTPKQGRYLTFIDAYTRLNRRPPAERDIQHHFGVTPPTVHQMILTLERAEFISTGRLTQHPSPRRTRTPADSAGLRSIGQNLCVRY
ncbi:MAG: MarR family winged helix-turn-helix transcriptional regulator [Bradyrhizobium sp.]|jgi:DNA-binding MarR family transcriptional regulator|uniref:LexA family protein n=1 Tax=Bradyrhizobium TaxID=374 RepID=UPI0027D9C790|nr:MULTISPECIES: MarR family winged helix-turn-helix transcriptional regulator [Bradyrhizobium]MDU0957957.1 MarR family winged helix-turn-helix transcriptional regulator [Bradyrhizobium sp.]MDU1497310.1 MarR family winged helix-turn-helix transcriptional regulator [Bradyrhizobium sp.]MDU1547449.1 MarR family winged helix-turn-helix transcriptional regulator [Bradyrhizobium sp.]MDU1664988.1 MarR family winged helix-turn-helix transcriptional regulator [Bradyrhizobium sp.]MDU1688626.1 MarR famil